MSNYENKEELKQHIHDLAVRIYNFDGEAYDLAGSSLGRTLTGDANTCIEELAELIYTHPQGYELRSDIALIGNMARTIKDKEQRHRLMKEYNDILVAVESLPETFNSEDIIDETLAGLNLSNMNRSFSENDHMIISISRTEGSAGTDIAFALADELRMNYYDADVLEHVMKNQDIQKDAKWNIGKFENISQVRDFSRCHGLSKRDAVFFNESELICELAKQQDFIVVGRCADNILTRNKIPHISVFITAPFETRAKRVMQLEHISYKEAVKRLKRMDRKRERFYHFYTLKRWGNAANYDLCINSASYGIQESVELIKRIISKRQEERVKPVK